MKKDAKTLFIIHQCVDADNFQKIRSVDTVKKAWDILEKSYAGDSKLKKVKLQTLRRQYELLLMSDLKSIGEFFSRILAITNQMNAYGDKQLDLGIIDKLLRTLTPRFDHIVYVKVCAYVQYSSNPLEIFHSLCKNPFTKSEPYRDNSSLVFRNPYNLRDPQSLNQSF